MRIVDYIVVAGKDLRRQTLRSFLTVVALGISTVILITMTALSMGGREAITAQYGTGNSLSTITVTPNQSSAGLSVFGSVQQVSSQSTTLNDETVGKLATLPNVASAVPRAHIWELKDFAIDGYNKQFVAQAEGIPGDDKSALAAGRGFSSNDQSDTVIVGKGFAKAVGLENTPEQLIGKTIRITTQPGYRGIGAAIPPTGASREENEAFSKRSSTLSATITGVTENGPDQNSLLLPLGWAHQLRTARYNEPSGLKSVDQLAADGYTSIQIRASDTAHVASISKTISELGYGQFSALAQLQQLQQLTTILWVVLGTVALIAAIAAALGVTNTMLMTVSEQRYVIGVWRAVGARRGVIIRMFLVQAAWLGLTGGLIGAGLAVVASHYVNQYAITLLSAQGLALSNVAVVSWQLAIGAIGLTTLFGILAGLYPAYRASRQDPSEALRAQ